MTYVLQCNELICRHLQPVVVSMGNPC